MEKRKTIILDKRGGTSFIKQAGLEINKEEILKKFKHSINEMRKEITKFLGI